MPPARSDHFQEFFRAAKGTATPLTDHRTTDANAPSAEDTQPHSRSAAPAILDPPLHSTDPLSSENLTPPAQGSGTTHDPATSAQEDPQTLRQQQNDQAETSGQADLQVRFADVGCGFGGLLVRLSPLYPNKLMVGMEIRDKVCVLFQTPVCLHATAWINGIIICL